MALKQKKTKAVQNEVPYFDPSDNSPKSVRAEFNKEVIIHLQKGGGSFVATSGNEHLITNETAHAYAQFIVRKAPAKKK